MLGRVRKFLGTRVGRVVAVFVTGAAVLLWVLPAEPVRSLALKRNTRAVSVDGALGARLMKADTVEIYRPADGQTLSSINHPGALTVWPEYFSPDGRFLLTLVRTRQLGKSVVTFHLWNCETGRKQAEIVCRGHHDTFRISPDGKHAVTAGERPVSEDRWPLDVWDLERGRRVLELAGHRSGMYLVDWSTDGSLILSAGQDQTLRLWNAVTGQEVRRLEWPASERDIHSVWFSPDGRYVFGRHYDRDPLWIWETATGRLLRSVELGPRYAYYRQAVTPTRHVFARHGDTYWMRDLLNNNPSWLPAWGRDALNRVRYSQDCIALDPDTGAWERLMKLPFRSSLAGVLPDKQQLVSARWTDDPPRLEWWDIPPGWPWMRALAWAVLLVGMYWSVSTLRAWRRGRVRSKRADLGSARDGAEPLHV